MTTMPIDNPLVDFSRADFSSFEVPHPIKAAAADSIIQENRARTPQSAINQRKQDRLTVSELNDMDMDEIVKRAYMVPVDTRGPVTRFLDLIDLPRNALFNLAAGDTARRKLAMGDTAALGLARVNTSDVLESLGVRPGIATGILGLVGDVALDPLTYLGPAGMGIKLTAAGGETVSMVGKAGKVFKNTIKEVEAGANISDDLARRYLESAGFTADRIASATDKKALAAEVADVLGQGKQTRTNKVLSWIAGEDVERAAVEGKRTIADDIHTYIAPELDDVQKARITAAQDFYKEYGRPFSPGVRIVKDPVSAIGFSFTTSKDVPKGSGIFHLPGTAYEISVPAFTPEAIKNTRLASLVKDAVISGEYFSSPEMKAVIDGHSAIDELARQAQESITASKPSKITEPVVEAAKPFNVGDEVQWTSQGAAQFETPRKITGISDDGKFAFVEGTNTGIPTEQLTRTGEAAKPSAVPAAETVAAPEAAAPAQQNILLHGSSSEFETLDPSKSGGGISLTDRRTTALNYASGSGGARKPGGTIIAMNENGVVYHKVGDEWVPYGFDVGDGKITPLNEIDLGETPKTLTQQEAQELEDRHQLFGLRGNSYVYQVDIGDAKILDLTTPEGKAVFAGLPKTSNARSNEIIERGLDWRDTKLAASTKAMEPIYEELRKLGYDGIKHFDDGPYTTTNIFNKDKLKIVGKEKVFQTPESMAAEKLLKESTAAAPEAATAAVVPSTTTAIVPTIASEPASKETQLSTIQSFTKEQIGAAHERIGKLADTMYEEAPINSNFTRAWTNVRKSLSTAENPESYSGAMWETPLPEGYNLESFLRDVQTMVDAANEHHAQGGLVNKTSVEELLGIAPGPTSIESLPSPTGVSEQGRMLEAKVSSAIPAAEQISKSAGPISVEEFKRKSIEFLRAMENNAENASTIDDLVGQHLDVMEFREALLEAIGILEENPTALKGFEVLKARAAENPNAWQAERLERVESILEAAKRSVSESIESKAALPTTATTKVVPPVALPAATTTTATKPAAVAPVVTSAAPATAPAAVAPAAAPAAKATTVVAPAVTKAPQTPGLEALVSAAVEGKKPMTELEIRQQALDNFRAAAEQKLNEIGEAIKKIEADPNAKYADLLYARDKYKVAAEQALSIDKDFNKAKAELEAGKKFSAGTDLEVSKKVNETLRGMRTERNERNVKVKQNIESIKAEEEKIKAEMTEANKQATADNPAVPLDPGVDIIGRLPSGIHKKDVFKTTEFAGHPDPAFDLARTGTEGDKRQAWRKYRTSPHGSEESNRALAEIMYEEVPVYDEEMLANIKQPGEFATQEELDAYENAVKQSITGYELQEKNPGETLRDLAVTDTQAFTHLQHTLLYNNQVSGKVQRIELSKLKVGDEFSFGKADKVHRSPLTVEVTHIDDEGRVYVKAKMPEKRPSALERFKKMTKEMLQKELRESKIVEDRYYILDPNATEIYATKGIESPTVRRKVQLEGEQMFTGNLDELNKDQKFNSRVNKLGLSVKRQKTLEERLNETSKVRKIDEKTYDRGINIVNQNVNEAISMIARQIYRTTKEEVPGVTLDRIHDEVANIVFKHPDLENIRGEDITRGVQAALFDEPVPAKFKYEPFSFNPKDSAAVREEAMKRLRLGEEDLVRSKLGEGTKYEGLGADSIRSELVADQLQETLRGMRFQMHPTVKTAYEAEMAAMETDRAARIAKSQQVNEEIAKRINDETKQIQRSGRKAAKDRMDQADVEWRERQRRWMTGEDFTTGGAGNMAPTTNIEEIKNGIYKQANDDIKVIEQQTQTALANVENDVRQKAAAEFGAAEFDTSLGKGTEYEGMGERQIRDAVLEKHANDFDAKVKAGEITGEETEKTMPKYLTQEEMVDKELQISYLHAKANIAARIANASTKPLLAAAGSEVQAAYQSAIQAMGLGADDLGSGILASMMTMTEPFANKNNYGKSMYELARNLERTFVNRMGLAPGRANEMVKQFVRAQDVMQTQAFRAASADMLRTLEKSGIDRSNWDKASSLAMALIFVGDKTIDEMKQTLAVRRDQAYVDVLEAISGGLLDKTINPKGAEAIQAIADKYRGILKNLDEGSGIPNYVPNVLTPQAQNFINFQHENQANLAKSAASSGGGVVPAEAFSERFQKPRSTIEHAWVDPVTNEPRRMLESEMAYMEFSQPYIESLRANNPELAQYIENRQGNVKSWLSLDESQRQAADTYYLSPHEINQRIKDSHEAAGGQGKEMFDNLTNRALNGNDFMYADVLHAIPVRLGSQERKYARDMLQKYLAPYELQVEQTVLNTSGVAAGGSKEITTTNGTKVRLVNEGGKQVIYVGNIRYRRPEVIISPEHSVNSALFMVGDRPVNAAYYPEQIADIIDDTAGFFGKPKPGSRGAKVFGDASYEDVMGRMAKGADKLTGYWKVFTLLHPSWTINDIIGNLFLMANMGISPETAIRNAKDALKLILASSRNDLEEMNRLRIKNKSGVEHIAGPLGQVVESGGAPEVSRQLRTTGEYVDPYAYSMISSMKKLATGDIAGAREEFMGAINESMSASKAAVKDSVATKPNLPPNAQQAMVGADFAFNQMLVRRVWQPWAHLNGLANNWLKATAYFSLLDDGYDAASAARLVSEKMLDMSVLTSTDRNARRLFPFYNWMKNSGVLGVREFFRNPKFFSVAPKVKQALEESFNGEQNLPENARPSWIRDQLALQIGTDPDTRRALTLTSSLPTEAATYAISFATSPFLGWGALQDSLAYVTNSLTPVIKTPLELGARKEFFTKRVISSEGGDITPSEYLIQQARPLRELGIGSLRGGPLLRAFSDSPVMGASRALIGGRLQPFDEERRVQNLQREYDERVDALRRRIGIAERENQKNESIARRIELLRLFNQMEGLGLNVPKWASKQVGQIKEAQSNE